MKVDWIRFTAAGRIRVDCFRSNLHFPGIASGAILLLLDQAGICASSGSACLADNADPFPVIAAMKPGEAAHQSVRFSLGPDHTAGEISEVVTALTGIAASLLSFAR